MKKGKEKRESGETKKKLREVFLGTDITVLSQRRFWRVRVLLREYYLMEMGVCENDLLR